MYYRRMHELVQPKISEREKERKKKKVPRGRIICQMKK
jgi:hypothetical protein